MRVPISVAAAATVLLLAGCADSPTPVEPDSSPDLHVGAHESSQALGPDVRAALAEVRRATARFHDIDAAMAAGYTVWSPDPFAPNATCASSAEGRMGYHLVKPALRGSPLNPAAADANLDPVQPEMLLYEKRRDGKLHLVGVEYLVFTAAWERVHGAGAPNPTLLGQTVPASSHSFPPLTAYPVDHYELHVWLWKPSPNGMFSHWNPNISC